MHAVALLAALTLAAAAAPSDAGRSLSDTVTAAKAARAACQRSGDASACPRTAKHAVHRGEDARLPNPLNVPGLAAPPSHTGRRLAHTPAAGDSGGSLPHMRHTHAWAGASPRGFFDLSHDSVVRNTTVLLDELLEPLLLAGIASCEPLLEADGTPANEHTAPFIDEAHGLVRNPLEIRFSLPASALAGGAEAAAALEAEGLRRRWAVGSAVVFGPQTLRRHPSFAPGTPCGAQVPLDAPFYTIADAQVVAEGGESGESGEGVVYFVAALAPAGLSSAVNFMNLHMEWNPDTDGELESRVAAGRSLGDASALAAYQVHRARRLATASKDLVAPMAINWNGDVLNPAATNPNIEFLPGGLLKCKDCWAFYAARLVLNVLVCIKTVSAGRYWNAGTSADLTTASAAWSGQYYGGLSSATQLPDCATLGLRDPIATGDVAMRVEAYLEGGAGFNFQLTSSPIDVTISSCATSSSPITAANLAACTKELLPWSELGEIDLTPLVGIPITINPAIRLRGAAQVNAKYDGELQIGRGYKAGIRMGGRIDMPSTGITVTPTITGINVMTLNATVLPTIIKAPTVFGATAEAWVYPDIKLSVWNALPFAVYPRLHVTAGFAIGLGPRSLRAGSDGAAAGTGDNSRALQTSGSTNTCPAAVGVAVGGFVEVIMDADMATGTIATTLGSMKPVQTAMGDALASLLTFQVMPDATSPYAPILPPTKILSMCLTSGTTSTATTDGTQPAGGGSSSGGSGGGGAQVSASPTGTPAAGSGGSGGGDSGGGGAAPQVSASPTGTPSALPTRSPAPTVAAARVMKRVADTLKPSLLGACTSLCLAGGYNTTAFGNGLVRLVPQLVAVAPTAAGTPTSSGCVCLQLMGALQGPSIVGSGAAARTGTAASSSSSSSSSRVRRLQTSSSETSILFVLSSSAGAPVTLSVSLPDGSSAGAVQFASTACVSGATTFCGDAVPTVFTAESGVSSGNSNANVPATAAAASSNGGAIAAAVILTLLLTLAAVGGTLYALRRRGTIVLLTRAQQLQGTKGVQGAKAGAATGGRASLATTSTTSFNNPMTNKDASTSASSSSLSSSSSSSPSTGAAAGAAPTPAAAAGGSDRAALVNPATGNASAAGSTGTPDGRKSFAAAQPRGRGSTASAKTLAGEASP